MTLLKRSVPTTGLTTYHSRLLFGINTTFLVLALIAVALRIYARKVKRASFVVEDWLVFTAMLGFGIQATLTYCAIFLGAAGHHEYSVKPRNVEKSLQILCGQGPPYGVAMLCSKWAICLLYKRIFVVKPFRIATYIVMAITFGWALLAFTVTWAFCVPIAFNWNKTIADGHCANVDAGFLVVGVVDATTDFVVLILPMPMIWRLKVPRQKQISLAIIFSIAILCTIVSALRAYYTSRINFQDFTESRVLLDVFSAIEPATSIIVASSLVLGPVVRLWFPRTSTPKSTTTKRSFRRIDDGMDRKLTSDIELGNKVNAQYEPPLIRDYGQRTFLDDLSVSRPSPPEKRPDAAMFNSIRIQREVTIC